MARAHEGTTTRPEGALAGGNGGITGPRRRSTETKSALKTTELAVFLITAIGVLIATAVVDAGNAGGLGARQGWLYVTLLAVGYMVSRGLAKSGSRDPYTEKDGDR
jgi:hypothetical protein